MTTSSGSETSRPALPGPLVLLLAVGSGVGVANIYFPQAITPAIGTALGVPASAAALAVTTGQLGYAVGLFLLIPLADRLAPRTLIPAMFAVAGAGLLMCGLAPSLGALIAASAAVGLVTVVPQAIIPIAANLASDERRGAITGQVTSGLLGGILLARTFSGTLGEWWGWRAPYLAAAGLSLLIAVIMVIALPRRRVASRQGYGALIGSTVRLFLTQPALRRSAFYQAVTFAAFTAAWTAIAFHLTGPHFGLSTSAVGIIALIGAASMFATPIAGRQTAARGADAVTTICLIGGVAAAAILLGGNLPSWAGIVALTCGMLVLDVAMQSGQVANQLRVFAIAPEARARLNTAYMTCAFLGGTAGSFLGAQVYAAVGWTGVCLAVAALAALALGRHLAHVIRHREATSAS